jgi:hypothetical protein
MSMRMYTADDRQVRAASSLDFLLSSLVDRRPPTTVVAPRVRAQAEGVSWSYSTNAIDC